MTDSELALLSILSERPMNSDEIQEVITQRNLREWTLMGTQSVYFILDKLQQQQLIERVPDAA
ncbi:MAG: hypothetical protein HC915_05880 [Anaerolineae bacterium]|nr:hypothetical protein [Anaerolineae bacterium]